MLMESGEGDTALWLAGNDQLELLQVIDLDPMLEHMQEILEILLPRCVVPQATTLIQCIYHNHWKLLMWSGINQCG